MVRREGLEPTCLAAPAPKAGASTNSATLAATDLTVRNPKSGKKTTYYTLAAFFDFAPHVGRPLRKFPGRIVAFAQAAAAAGRDHLPLRPQRRRLRRRRHRSGRCTACQIKRLPGRARAHRARRDPASRAVS